MCGRAACGDSVALYKEGLDEVVEGADDVDQSVVIKRIQLVGSRTAAASEHADLVVVTYALGVFLTAVILLGFRSRLIEYRFRSR
jgi:hypothetical protein